MVAASEIKPNPEFGHLASAERVDRTVAALGANGFDAVVVADGAAAKRRLLELVPSGAEVFTSLSRTLEITGIAAELSETGRYDAIRPKLAKLDRATQGREMRKLAAAPDFVVGSVHAVTEDGQVLIASGSGSQIGHYAYEAGKVIWVVGAQKIVRDIPEGLRRIEEYSYPLENQRMLEVRGIPTLLGKILIMKRGLPAGRITLIFVNQNIGF
jgi:hypothetical protein